MKRLSRLGPQRHSGFKCSVLLLGCLFTAQATSLSTNLASAQTSVTGFQGRTITEIQVRGNRRISTSTILAKIRSKPGQPYQDQAINQDIKSLQQMKGIYDVYLSVKDTPEKLILIFGVFEESVVSSIEFVGNRSFTDDELYKLLPFQAGDAGDTYLLARGRQALLDHYRKAGYDRSAVTVIPSQTKLVYRIVEGPKIRIRKISFQGNKKISSRQLRSQIATKPYTFIFSDGHLDRQQIDNDISKLVQYFLEKGYLDARVDKRPLAYSSDQKWVELTFLVNEGVPYRVRQVRFEGNENISSRDLLAMLKVGPGDVPVGSHIVGHNATNTLRITQAYGQLGYADVQINLDFVYLPDEPGFVDLLYNVSEGSQFRVGKIDIFGNKVTQDRVIRRRLLLAPGDLYNTLKIQRSQQRLLESSLFSNVQFSDEPVSGFRRDLKINVTEDHTALFMMGVSVNSDAGVLGNFSFAQRNFDLFNFPTFQGAGQLLRFNATPGSDLTQFSIDFREPYVADLPISFAQSIYLHTRGRDDYDESRLGARWSLGYGFWDGWRIEGTLTLEQATIDDIDADTAAEILASKGSHNLTAVKGTFIRNTTDSLFLPSRGDDFRISYEQTGAFGGDFDFGRLEAHYSRYFTTHTDSLDRKGILAFKARLANIFGDAPFFERYYAGGISTIRGFDFRGVSPRVPSVISGSPTAIGSDWLVIAGTEYSFPLIGEDLRGAFFLDTAALEEGDYRVSAGLSIRLKVPYLAPVPLSADFAWPLCRDDDDDTRVFSFYFATSFW